MSLHATAQLPADQPGIITTRVVAAPRELIWKVLTTPEHIKHFWGPDGFSNTITKMDVKKNGQWLFTMHGPDGTSYPNRVIYRELDQPRFMRHDHDDGSDGGFRFVGEIELTDLGNEKTKIELRVILDSITTRDAIAGYAAEGGIQNLDRLAAHVAPMADPKNLFEIERTYPVAQNRLFRALTDIDDMKQWFAPKGMKVIKAEQDLKPGGTYHYGLASDQGHEMWGKINYKEITPSSRLVYRQSFSDRDGGLTRHPMAPTWPMEMLTVMELTPGGENQSRLKISWIYSGTDDTEAQTFQSAHEGMRGGWTGTLDGLGAYLASRA